MTGITRHMIQSTGQRDTAKLVWKALRGATPALAPGALAQLGLLGLLYTYRHPALTHTRETEE